jgi:hypothetical protein
LFQKLGRALDSRAARSWTGAWFDDTPGVRSASPPSAGARSAAATATDGNTGVAAAANAAKKASTARETRARKARSL